ITSHDAGTPVAITRVTRPTYTHQAKRGCAMMAWCHWCCWATSCSGRKRSSAPVAHMAAPIATSSSKGRAARNRRMSIDYPAAACVFRQDLACLVPVQVAYDADSASLQLRDPVRRQRAFVEFGQRFHVFAARADEQRIDAGPDQGAETLAARLGAGRQGVRPAVLVEPEPLQA